MIKHRDLIDAGNKPKKLKTRLTLFIKPQLRNINLKEIVAEYNPHRDLYMMSGWLDAQINIHDVNLLLFKSTVEHYL